VKELFYLSDTLLIQKIISGDSNAFKELVRKYENQIAKTIISMLGHCPEADDVGQETFIRFYQNIDKFKGNSSVGTYITRIAINLSLNELKRRKRNRMLFVKDLYENDSDFPDINGNNAYNDDKEIIQQAIQKLEPKFRSVIVLRLIDGYSTIETAEILKIPLGTVLSRLARAQMKLKKILSPIFGECDE
jgi:RNA polymerase sigma-70 factor (ECF subfamily)